MKLLIDAHSLLDLKPGCSNSEIDEAFHKKSLTCGNRNMYNNLLEAARHLKKRNLSLADPLHSNCQRWSNPSHRYLGFNPPLRRSHLEVIPESEFEDTPLPDLYDTIAPRSMSSGYSITKSTIQRNGEVHEHGHATSMHNGRVKKYIYRNGGWHPAPKHIRF